MVLGNIERTEKFYEQLTKPQKKKLLRGLNINDSFAEAKTIKEMVNRGGGLGARKLLDLTREFKKRNPNTHILGVDD